MKASRKTFSKSTNDYLIRPLLRQRDTGELCDVEFKLNGRKLHAHRAIIALWSPYFLSMFTCDMREKNTREVDLSASLSLENDDVLGRVLDFMYTGSIVITTDNVVDVIVISDFFLMDDLKEYCKQFLLDFGNLDLTNCLRVRFLADDHNMPEVAVAAQQIIESRFHDYLIHHEEVLDLPAHCLLRLLQIPTVVQHTSYIELKKAVEHWVDHDKSSRQQYQTCLMDSVKSWISDFANEASYLGRELRRSLEGADAVVAFQVDKNVNSNMNLIDSTPAISNELTSPDKTECPVLFSVVCNQGLKFMKILLYNLTLQKWFHFPLSGDRLLQYVPVRQTVCNLLVHEARLYMYLCHSFPYPTDMLKINILVVDLITGQPSLFSFRTIDNYNPCYRTTLTNFSNRSPCHEDCTSEGHAYGYQLVTATEDSIYLLNNQQPYMTSLYEISEKFPCAMAHIPPPIDNISVVAHGNIPLSVLQPLVACNRYDEAYANALHVTLQPSDGETDDSASCCDVKESDNDDYEYDDDIYDYDFNYDIDGLDF
ncbi:hypothetical protein C0Q70_13650 [Pomacea canaliculata]|uniref:BTB domain-containing protein n=1 Tax=Pomacea canaliculata TaxID=400727 RepID=A0A2T7NXW2_POMCA|nr:hypothetical protein C0Q70_13650 [Pomacea canaliculata]